MGGSSKSVSTPEVATVEVPAPLPTLHDEATAEAADDARRRLAASQGHSATILTGSTGLTSTANTDKKSILGG